MKYRRNLLLSLSLLGLAVFWIVRSSDIHAATEAALRLCVYSLLPALFPFFVLTSFLISLGFPAALGRLLRGPMERLFHLGGSGASALLLGFLGGYPTGARTVCELYTAGELSKEEAERALSFANNCSPAFFVSFVGSEVFHAPRLGLLLWLIHVLSALSVGLLFRGKAPARRCVLPRREAESLSAALIRAVASALSAYLTVCSFVLLFSVLSFPLAEHPLLLGFFELSRGVAALPTTRLGFALAGFFCGFGGLAVQLQSLAFILPAGLSPKKHLAGKLLQGLLAGLLSFFAAPLLF